MRRACSPCLVDEAGRSVPLEHIDFTDVHIAESFLQEVLHATPEVLPVDEIDGSFGPLVSLGREISNIDNLFISPTGRLTIVETKLWRNPEATRQVVAQVLDYATRVSTWTYSELERRARQEALQPAPLGDESLYQFVVSKSPQDVLPEHEFVDAVERSLRTGRFMLLIVGDGIRENVESMVGALHEHPQRLFTFGLVQLQIYRTNALPGAHLVVPQVLANTTEIVRAVVRVETTGQATVNVEMERESNPSNTAPRHTLSEEEFFENFKNEKTRGCVRQLLDFGAEMGAVPAWGSSAVSMRLPDPAGSATRYTLYVVSRAGNLYVGWLPQQLQKTGLPVGIAADFASGLCKIFPSLSLKEGGLEPLGVVPVSGVVAKWDDFSQIVQDLVGRLGTTE